MLRLIQGGNPPKGAVTTVSALMSKVLCVIDNKGNYTIRKGCEIIETGRGGRTGRSRANTLRVNERRAAMWCYEKAAGGPHREIKIRPHKSLEQVLGPICLAGSDELITNFNQR